MSIDYTSLSSALQQLSIALSYAEKEKDIESQLLGVFTAAVIQSFGFSYELSVKMLRRCLESIEPSKPLISELGYKDLVRVGAEKGMIDKPEDWFWYREKRNITTHTYDKQKAREVYVIARPFYTSATQLLTQLKNK